MAHTFLALAHFDGSRFVGWQRQREGRSIQAEFERVLERLAGQPVAAHAAGRTDAGVHALGLGVSFSLPREWEPTALRRALNALLSPDCWIQTIAPMRPGFHARKSALARAYRYDVGTDQGSASPFRRPYEWALGRPLELASLRAAGETILGEHDFQPFSVRGQERAHWRCRISRSDWTERIEGRGLSYHVEADRFLHHMVRMLVGTMVDIGLGRRPVADMSALLVRGDNLETSPPAPPEGLYFVSALYPADCYSVPHTPPMEQSFAAPPA
jgi:tRNA pseudouridine38-40 synthase